MAKLAGNVTVRNPETGEQETLLAGADAPGWAEALITNPNAWEGDPPAAATKAAGQDDDEEQPKTSRSRRS
jgi:hypothetical protein